MFGEGFCVNSETGWEDKLGSKVWLLWGRIELQVVVRGGQNRGWLKGSNSTIPYIRPNTNQPKPAQSETRKRGFEAWKNQYGFSDIQISSSLTLLPISVDFLSINIVQLFDTRSGSTFKARVF